MSFERESEGGSRRHTNKCNCRFVEVKKFDLDG